jgi:hypothetical protein
MEEDEQVAGRGGGFKRLITDMLTFHPFKAILIFFLYSTFCNYCLPSHFGSRIADHLLSSRSRRITGGKVPLAGFSPIVDPDLTHTTILLRNDQGQFCDHAGVCG